MNINLRPLFTKKAAAICINSAVAAAITAMCFEQYDDARAINHPDRTINIDGEITEESADQIIAELLALNLSDPDARINVHINSIGGSVQDGNRIINAINRLNNPIYAVCENVASMAFIIFTSADFERRYVQPDCSGMYHQSHIPIEYTDEEIQAGAPEHDTFKLDELRSILETMQQNNSISYHEEYIGWERSVTKEQAIRYINAIEHTNQQFSYAISRSSELNEGDVELFDTDDVYFTARQMLWAGLADDYVGGNNPIMINIEEDRFCAQYDVSLCPE